MHIQTVHARITGKRQNDWLLAAERTCAVRWSKPVVDRPLKGRMPPGTCADCWSVLRGILLSSVSGRRTVSPAECRQRYRPTLFTWWSKHEANLEHTSCTCILNTFVSCLFPCVNGIYYACAAITAHLSHVIICELLQDVAIKSNTINTTICIGLTLTNSYSPISKKIKLLQRKDGQFYMLLYDTLQWFLVEFIFCIFNRQLDA